MVDDQYSFITFQLFYYFHWKKVFNLLKVDSIDKKKNMIENYNFSVFSCEKNWAA